jgi:ketosteroid isomerase-like protein
MSTHENVQIVKDFFAATGRGDKQGLLAISAEGIEWIIPGEWPLAGTHVEIGRPSFNDPAPGR